MPIGKSTAVLPPTEESTAARSVVGICTQSTPRMYAAAAKPAKSPTTPPPNATTKSLRVSSRAAKNSTVRANVASVFALFAVGKGKYVRADARLCKRGDERVRVKRPHAIVCNHSAAAAAHRLGKCAPPAPPSRPGPMSTS